MKKKMLALMLALAMTAAMTACGGNQEDGATIEETDTSVQDVMAETEDVSGDEETVEMPDEGTEETEESVTEESVEENEDVTETPEQKELPAEKPDVKPAENVSSTPKKENNTTSQKPVSSSKPNQPVEDPISKPVEKPAEKPAETQKPETPPVEETQPEKPEEKPEEQPEEEKPVETPVEPPVESQTSVDLSAFYEKLASNTADWPAMMPVDGEALDAFYAGLGGINTKQCAVYMPMISSVVCEVALVEVANAADVQKVKNIFQSRISYQVGDDNNPGGAWYPESIEGWKNHSRVVANGNYVMMVAFSQADSVVGSFNALFK